MSNDISFGSVFKKKKTPLRQTKNMTIRIPLDLYQRIENLREEASRNGQIFAVSDVVIAALYGAVDVGESEMLSANPTPCAPAHAGSTS